MNARAIATLAFLVALGSMQMAADVLLMPRLKAFFAATQVSPAMKVFTAHQGYETHAARFAIGWLDDDGSERRLALDPDTYGRVQGPYNRRNVYGAALAYGPLMRVDPKLRAMQESVMRYAFCAPGDLRSELGLPGVDTNLKIYVMPVQQPARTDLELSWEVECHA
jgi:hypothetical protein